MKHTKEEEATGFAETEWLCGHCPGSKISGARTLVSRVLEAAAAHKETAHYERWRDTVAEMMAEPRQGIKYTNIFPSDDNW